MDLIKTSKANVQPVAESHRSSVAHDIKNSYIQNLHMKSSMFMLWLATALLSYGSKIPFIKQIISMLSIWYGRTTIWKILVKLRKLFIMFNAVIGVYMVFKTVGFSFDNVLAGFAGMGHSYLEIFTNFTKRMFHWFVELFDHRVIPNVPGDKGTGTLSKNIWLPKGIESNSYYPKPNVEESLRKSYNSLFSINVEPTPQVSWYRDLPTWLYIGGIIAGGVLILGGAICVYKVITDPSILLGNSDVANVKGKMRDAGPSVVAISPEGSTILPEPSAAIESNIALKVSKAIVKTLFKPFKYLNPNYWVALTPEETADYIAFENKQMSAQFEVAYYPFTKYNPFDNWFTKMRIKYLGETSGEMTARDLLKAEIQESFRPVGEVAATTQLPAIGLEKVSNLSSGSVTPRANTLGLGIDYGQSVESTSTFFQTSAKISSLPHTPTMDPLNESSLTNIGENLVRKLKHPTENHHFIIFKYKREYVQCDIFHNK